MRWAGPYISLLFLVGACCWVPPPSAGSAPAPAPPIPPGAAELDALESHLSEGRHYAEGLGAEVVAQAVRPVLEPRDALAVRTTNAADGHQRVVVVIRFDDDATEGLADLDDEQRQVYLESLLETVASLAGPTADIGIGIRGNIFYGAVAIARAGAVPTYDMGFTVPTDELAGLLAPIPVAVPSPAPVPPSAPPDPAAPPAPAPVPATP
jgi:hypothetical protein